MLFDFIVNLWFIYSILKFLRISVIFHKYKLLQMKIKYQLELLVVDNKTNKFTKPCNWTTKQISNKSRTLWLWFLHFIFSLSCQHKQEYSTSINWLIKSFFRLQNCMIFYYFSVQAQLKCSEISYHVRWWIHEPSIMPNDI